MSHFLGISKPRLQHGCFRALLDVQRVKVKVQSSHTSSSWLKMADWEALFPVLKNIFFFQLICTVCLLLLLFKYPVLIYRFWQSLIIFITGFRVRKCHVADNYAFEFIERGSKDVQEVSVLLVHGFTSGKENWCMMASYFPKRFHVIAVDLPGHGGTTRKENDDISIPSLVRRIEQFAAAVGLNKKKYYLIGTSLGGAIAGVQSAMFPDHILSTILVCPFGMNAPVKSQVLTAYDKEGRIQLLPENEEQFQRMTGVVVHKPLVKLPKIFISGIVTARKKAHGFYVKLWEEMMTNSNRCILQDHLQEIKSKVFVVWGKLDYVLDVSGADVIRKKLPNCTMEILDDCGHAIELEKLQKLAKILTKFIDESSNS